MLCYSYGEGAVTVPQDGVDLVSFELGIMTKSFILCRPQALMFGGYLLKS